MFSAAHLGLAVLTFTLALGGHVEARNKPCSGKKGGVAGCQGEKFLCKDGTLSKSKRMCSRDQAASEQDEVAEPTDEGKAER